MPTDTKLYDDALDAEANGHIGLGRGRVYAAPGKDTMAVIDRIAAELAAKHGAPLKAPKKGPQNPYVNHYGKVLDPVKAARWVIDQHRQRMAEARALKDVAE